MFKWFKPWSVQTGETNATTERNVLHGHDLAKWNYLGYSTCSYIGSTGETYRENPIFFFVAKDNEKKRSYKLVGPSAEDTEKNHSFVNLSVKPWKSGEGSIYGLISGEAARPSEYLKGYMLEKFGCQWSTETHWWATSSSAKYEQATSKQTTTKKTSVKKKATEKDNNVIKVDFSGD